jgi:hypothetical protein
MVCIKGRGPLKRRMRSKDFLRSFFDTWDHIYLSMDGFSLYLFLSRNASEPIAIIPLVSLKKLHIERTTDQFPTGTRVIEEGGKKEKMMEDRYYVILSTSNNDIIQIK